MRPWERIAKLSAPGLRLTPQQKAGVLFGGDDWRSARAAAVNGITMEALARRGLAEVAVRRRPHRHYVYRLTPAGLELRGRWESAETERQRATGFAAPEQPLAAAAAAAWDERFAAETAPPAHAPVRVRCTHCGAAFEDGTDGGGCGRCGLTVQMASGLAEQVDGDA